MKKISVILAVYNGAEFIEETINSILHQTYSNLEIIVVVNCSNDKTIDIVNSIDDSRITLYTTNICQLAFNLNYGLYKSTCEYIMRIDADDIAEPNRIEKQVHYIKELHYDVVGSNVIYINENNEIIGEKQYPETNEAIRKSIYYKNNFAHPSVMYKKETVLAVGGYLNGKMSEDYDLWIRLMNNKEVKFYNIQTNLTKYRIHSKQVKGNKYAYAEIAGYFLRETLSNKSMKSFFGMLVYIIKAIIK